MRFLVDECAGPTLARWLANQGHEVFSVFDDARGLADTVIIQKAVIEGWIIVTADKDFGAMIFRDKHPHHGVILLRLEDNRASMKIAVMKKFMEQYGNRLNEHYIVVTEDRVRFARF